MAKNSTTSNLTAELELSCDMDVIYVDSAYKVPAKQTMMTALILRVDSFPVDIITYLVEPQGITGAQHSIDKNGVLTLYFPVDCQVLKGSFVRVTGYGTYKGSKQKYSASAIIKIVPVVSNETVRLLPSVSKIKWSNEYKRYNPDTLTVNLERDFNGIRSILSIPYKWYRITYAFSDDPYNEIQYTDTLQLTKLIGVRSPDHVMLNLYRDSAENIPLQSIRIPIYQTENLTQSTRSVIVDLDNESDSILTDANYVVTAPKTIQTRLSMYVKGSILPFKETDSAEVSLKTVDPEEELYLKNIIIETDIVEGSGELAIKYKFPQNIQIPKKIISNWNVEINDNGTVWAGACQFIISALPGMQSIYKLSLNSSVIRVDPATKKRGPVVVICEKYRWAGDTLELTDDGYIIYSIDGNEPKAYDSPVLTDTAEQYIKFEYYDKNGFLVDQETLHVIYDNRVPIEDNTDVVKSIRKFYIATARDNAKLWYPSLKEPDWIEDERPGPDKWNEEKPYLWEYQTTTYVNIAKNITEVVATRPTLIQKYAKGMLDCIEYYYAHDNLTDKIGVRVSEVNGVKTFYVTRQEGDKWVDVTAKLDVQKPVTHAASGSIIGSVLSVKWSKEPISLSATNKALWNFTYYTYTEGKDHYTTPVLIGTWAENGDAGIQGCIIQTSTWDSEKSYYNDTNYRPTEATTLRIIDVVYYKRDGNYYMAKDQANSIYTDPKQRVAITGHVPTDTTYWKIIEDNGLIKTDLIIAKNAVLEMAQGNEFIMMNKDQQVVGGLSGYDEANQNNIRIFVGTQTDVSSYKFLKDNKTPGARALDDEASAYDSQQDTIESITARYSKQQAPFRVYEDGTLVSTNAQINGNFINQPEGCMYYTSIANDEFLYRNKANNLMIAMMPIKNPYTQSKKYKSDYSDIWVSESQHIPALVFYTPSGEVGTWIDYRGIHVASKFTNLDSSVEHHKAMYIVAEDLQNAVEDITNNPTKCYNQWDLFRVEYDYIGQEPTSKQGDGPVSLVNINKYSSHFNMFESVSTSFYIYPLAGYTSWSLLKDTQFTINTEYSYVQGSVVSIYDGQKREQNVVNFTPVTAKEVTVHETSNSADTYKSILTNIFGITENITLNASDTEVVNFSNIWDNSTVNNLNTGYKSFIEKCMSTKTVPTIYGHILTLYTKRFNRSLYYLDSACTKLVTYDSNELIKNGIGLDFPITEIDVYPHAIPTSVFYKWFDIKDKNTSQQSKARTSIDLIKPGSGSSQWEEKYEPKEVTTPTNISCINGIQLVTDQLYSKVYSICPQHSIFNKDTGEFLYHPNIIFFLYLQAPLQLHGISKQKLGCLTAYIPHNIDFEDLKDKIRKQLPKEQNTLVNENYNISDFWKDMYTYYDRCKRDFGNVSYPPEKLFNIDRLTFEEFLIYFDDLLSYKNFLAPVFNTIDHIEVTDLKIEEWDTTDNTPSGKNLYFRWGENNNKDQTIDQVGGLTEPEDIRIWAVVTGALIYAQITGVIEYGNLQNISDSNEYLIIKPQLLFTKGQIDNFVSLHRASWPGNPEKIKNHNTYIKVEDETYTLPVYNRLAMYQQFEQNMKLPSVDEKPGEIFQPKD